jgi:uncharacterized membrane protein (UPF0136 family)
MSTDNPVLLIGLIAIIAALIGYFWKGSRKNEHR